jgi:HK97 family phage major capsid protein
MSKLQEKQTELIKLRGEWATLFKSKPDRDFDESELTTLQNKNDVMATLAKEVETLETLEKAAGENEREHEWLTKGVGVLHPNGEHKSGTQSEAKSVRELVEGDASFKRLAENRGAGTAQIELPSAMFKTLLALTDMYPNAQTTAFRPMAVETRTVRDLFAEGNTTSNVIQYWEETSLVNNAAAVAEGGTKPESALDFTLRSNIVEKIATWLPVTREMLSDVPQSRSLIENRLRYMVAMEVDDQLINGNGTTPNISGILDRSGVQTTAAASAAAAIDAIMTAITLIRVNALAEPDGIIMHPNDFSAIATLRTADGIYLLGNPQADPNFRLWGLPIRVTTTRTENTAIVGAFRTMAQIFEREGVTVTASSEHSTYFIENKVAILAETRLALAVYRPAAFCTVTGL